MQEKKKMKTHPHLCDLRGHRSSLEFLEESSCVHDVPQKRFVPLSFSRTYDGERLGQFIDRTRWTK